ncbi:MAG: radical SAM protein [Candidatus Methanomethylophilaceae archaeon]|nr:radical SAM protein [Candidatus Methanomethylophilaceae archaeon]
MKFERMDCGSLRNGPLAKGCEHCLVGGKMVLFVTGRCDTGCYYCPVSFEKKGKDCIYANELKTNSKAAILEEAESMDATGTGITGGDPLMNVDRTVNAIRMLKERFGPEHHIHLYTSTIDPLKVRMVAEAGLDEIRFHPRTDMWDHMQDTLLKEIVDTVDIDVGIEVPALPDHRDGLDALADYAQSIGIDFVNLNELEFSESNWDMMEKYGYDLVDELSSAVKGSAETAEYVMKRHPDLRMHCCSSTFKDGVQLRNRLKRKAEKSAKEYEVITDDGTVIKGVLYGDLEEAMRLLSEEYDVPGVLMHLDEERNRLEVAPWVLEEIASELPYRCYEVEEYPTADRLEVERAPLN